MSTPSFKLKTSLFFKLFLVLLSAGFLITVASGIAHSLHMSAQADSQVRTRGESFARYLIWGLGSPPLFEGGAALADEFGVGIRIEGKGWKWTSSPQVPEISELPKHGNDLWRPAPPPNPIFLPLRFAFGGSQRGPFVVVDHEFPDGTAKVLVMGMRPPFFRRSLAPMIFHLVATLLILVGDYLTIRWILSPIKSLTKGVGMIAAGKLDHRVPIEGNDELGTLAEAFNSMVVRVTEMIELKQQLLLDVSHELRSPLTRAKIGVALLDEDETTRKITRDLEELEKMLEHLLASARLDSGQGDLSLESSDVVSLTKDVVRLYSEHGKNVNLVDSHSSIVTQIDADRFKSVIMNLIDNALKYSPPGKPVSVSIYECPKVFRVLVKDEGVGIPQGEVEKVFEPFYRVDKSRTRKTGGFGLGLSLCRKIVEAHGGKIKLTSEPTVGTTVEIIIPLLA